MVSRHPPTLFNFQMQLKIGLFYLLTCLFISQAAFAEIIDEYREYDLAKQSLYLIDDNDSLNVNVIKAHTDRLNWRTPEKDQLNFGFLNEPVWVKVEMEIGGVFPDPWLLNIDYPPLDRISLYFYLNGKHLDTVEMGDTLPFKNRPLLSKNYLYRMQLNQGDHLTVYARVQSSGNLLIPLKITPVNDYISEAQKRNILTSALYGVLLVMGLYNLLISFIVKDKHYIIYVGWVFSSLLFIFTLNGDAFQLLWPDHPEINDYMLTSMLPITGFLNALFVLKFLQIEKNRKNIAKIFYFIMVLYTISLVVSLFGNYSISMKFAFSVNSFVLLIITFTVLYLVIKRQPGSIIFFLAFSLLILSAIVLSLGTANIIPKTLFTVYANQLAQALETIIFSLALAQKIEAERKLRIQKEQEAYEFSEQAKEHMSQYQSLFNNSPLGIFRFTQNGDIQTYNPAFSKLFNDHGNNTLKNAVGIIFRDTEHIENSIQQAENHDTLYEEELDLSSGSGALWISLIIMPINGGSHLYEGQIKDITIEKLSELEGEEQERQKAEMISRLVSGVAHEINTPIGTNITALSLLDEELSTVRDLFDQSTMTRDNLASFFSTCDNVSDIVTLNQRRISALIKKFKEVSVNRLSMTKHQFDLINAIKHISSTYESEECNIKLIVPDGTLVIDSFEQAYAEIIAQLISNSIKFCENEVVEITITLSVDETTPRFIYQDNGPGIEDDVKKKHAFEPFYTTRPGDPECTGLGMFAISNLCKQLLHTTPIILNTKGFGLSFEIHEHALESHLNPGAAT